MAPEAGGHQLGCVQNGTDEIVLLNRDQKGFHDNHLGSRPARALSSDYTWPGPRSASSGVTRLMIAELDR
jgi:hypothetical protein